MIELNITAEGIERTDYDSRGETKYHIKYPDIDNLPDDIKTKLSALKLMQDGADIDDVGHKVSKSIYWIYEGPSLITDFKVSMVFSCAILHKTTLKAAWDHLVDFMRTAAKGLDI